MRTKLRAVLVHDHEEPPIDRVMRDLFWSPPHVVRRSAVVIAFRQRSHTQP